MSKVAVFSDTHWGARNSSLIFLEYMAWYWREVFFPYCKANGITDVICAGDFFDNRNNVNLRTLHYVRKHFVKVLEDYGITLHIIPGNHDIFYRNDNEITSLEILEDSEYVRVYHEPTDQEIGELTFFLCPWINNNNYESTMEAMASSKADVMIGHLEVAGFKMYKHSVSEHGMPAETFKKFRRVISGHFHHPSTIGNITYLGSPFHLTWQDYDDKRGFTVIDTETKEEEYIENPHCLFTRIYYDDREIDYREQEVSDLENRFVELVVQHKEKEASYLDFINRIREVNTWAFEIIDKTQLVIGDEVSIDAEALKHDTLSLTKDYIKTVVDEDEVLLTSSLMSEIYDAAVELRSKGE